MSKLYCLANSFTPSKLSHETIIYTSFLFFHAFSFHLYTVNALHRRSYLPTTFEASLTHTKEHSQ